MAHNYRVHASVYFRSRQIDEAVACISQNDKLRLAYIIALAASHHRPPELSFGQIQRTVDSPEAGKAWSIEVKLAVQPQKMYFSLYRKAIGGARSCLISHITLRSSRLVCAALRLKTTAKIAEQGQSAQRKLKLRDHPGARWRLSL